MATLWLLGRTAAEPALVEALARRGVTIRTHDGSPAELVRRTYDSSALVLVDAADPEAQVLLAGPAGASMPLVVRHAADGPLPEGLSLSAALDADAQAHHLADVLRDARSLRRHPRVPVRRTLHIGETVGFTRDVSLYGVRLEGDPKLPPGDFVGELAAGVEQPAIRLVLREVSRHADSVALRCRPERDLDLVVWLDLLLGELSASPLHRDVDPFGPLFAVD